MNHQKLDSIRQKYGHTPKKYTHLRSNTYEPISTFSRLTQKTDKHHENPSTYRQSTSIYNPLASCNKSLSVMKNSKKNKKEQETSKMSSISTTFDFEASFGNYDKMALRQIILQKNMADLAKKPQKVKGLTNLSNQYKESYDIIQNYRKRIRSTYNENISSKQISQFEEEMANQNSYITPKKQSNIDNMQQSKADSAVSQIRISKLSQISPSLLKKRYEVSNLDRLQQKIQNVLKRGIR